MMAPSVVITITSVVDAWMSATRGMCAGRFIYAERYSYMHALCARLMVFLLRMYVCLNPMGLT